MTHRLHSILIAALAGFVLAGCEETAPTEATLPGLSTTVGNRSSNVTGPPAESGPYVVRVEFEPAFIVFYNPEEQLLSVSATEDGFFCSPPTAIEPVSRMLVDTPAGPLHLLDNTYPHFTRVFGPATPAELFADFCGFMTNGPLLAEGAARVMIIDNDVFAEGPGANTWEFKVQGTLEDAINGGNIHLYVHQRFLVTPEGEFKVLVWTGPSLGPAGN